MEDKRFYLEKRELDPERVELGDLFNSLSGQYGAERVLKYIEENTEIAPIVVSRWLRNQPPQSSSIRRAVLNCLRYFQPTPSLLAARIENVLIERKKSVVVPKSEEKPEEVIQKPKPKRKKVIKEWELEGRYEGLNLYESDLLDHLKSSFGDSEFNIQDIKFSLKKARGHTHMFQHLAYLKALGYVEGPIIRDFRYYYKVIK